VAASNRARSGTSTWSVSRSRERTRVASSECPPSSKKLSSRPTRSAFRTSDQIPAIISSSGVRGAEKAAPPAAAPGMGSARRSTLPLGLSGRASSGTSTAGTMCSSSEVARWARSPAGEISAPAAATT
jgi:hypothetical protein